MLEAGYSEESARQQTNTLNTLGLKEELKPIVDRLETERDEILKEMMKKRGKAKYGELSKSFDILIKNMQLLGGKPTEIIDSYDWGHYADKKENNNIHPEVVD